MFKAYSNDRDNYQAPIELVKILLDNGADPHKSHDTHNLESEYPLYTAVRCKNIELAELLVKAGADINQKIDDPDPASTFVAFAIFNRDLAVVAFLLDVGAELRKSFVSEIPALAWAAIDCPRIYKTLRSHAPEPPDNIDVPGIIYASEEGGSCLSDYLHGASERDETEITKLLERALYTLVSCDLDTSNRLEVLLTIGVIPNVPTQPGSLPLVSVLNINAYCKFRNAELLLSKGADPNAPGTLHECASDFDTLELVINYGADVTKATGGAFCRAIGSHSIECIALLIESGANVNSRAPEFTGNPTPLQYFSLARQWNYRKYANSGFSVELAAFLINYGADVNASPRLIDGYTALQGAALSGDLPLLRYYLDIGVDVNAAPANIRGTTALEAAAQNKIHKDKQAVFHLLVQAGARLNRAEGESKLQATTSTLHALIETRSIDLVSFAISAGADINFKTCGKEGRTPLQLATEKGNFDLVELLLQTGAKVNAPAANNFGRTALQAAAFYETPKMELVKLLLEYGAEINAKPAMVGGVTALQASAIRGHVPVATLLLESGAEVNAKPAVKDGCTAIEGAAEHGRLDMVQLLINAGAIGVSGTGFQKAIDAAERNCHFAVVDMLEEHQKTLDLFPVV